jgi:hypothetical protein
MAKFFQSVVLSAVLVPGAAYAGFGLLERVQVERTLLADEGRYGGCMALLDRQISTAGVDCPSRWVSFSCSGDFNARDVALRMFDAAQMSLALDLPVNIVVDDERKHNGYCYANRIDVYR